MTSAADYTFAQWEQAFPMDEPFPLRENQLAADSCFIAISTISPLPVASHWETWGWADEPQALLGYTANVVLPDLIATWFFEQTEGKRLPSREYLSMARSQGILTADLPIAEEVVDVLDALTAQAHPSREDVVAGLMRAADLWNARFARTPTWDLSYVVYPTLEEAADALWQRHYKDNPPEYLGNDLTEDRWAQMCRSGIVDPATREYITGLFGEDYF